MMSMVGLIVVVLVACYYPSPSSACGYHGHYASLSDELQDTGLTQLLEIQSDAKPPKSIKGKIKLNGQFYDTSCQCSDSALTGTCNPPFRLHVHQEKINQEVGLSKRQLKRILGRPTSFQLRNVEKMSFACIEGRERRSVLGTPGGDFGEFLNALQVYEFLTNSTFTKEKVKEYLADWLMINPNRFYYHTDEHAISTLEKNLRVNSEKGTVGLDLENPPKPLQHELLEELIKAPHQGCYYLKAIISDPARFYIRPGLIHGLIRSLYMLLWDKERQGPRGPLHSQIDFVILSGEPQEKAWINFRSNHRCEDDHQAPIFPPRSTNGTQVFVNHPEAVGVLRTTLARFFLTRNPPVLATLSEFIGYLNRQGLFAMETTAETLGGARIPYYTVQVE